MTTSVVLHTRAIKQLEDTVHQLPYKIWSAPV